MGLDNPVSRLKNYTPRQEENLNRTESPEDYVRRDRNLLSLLSRTMNEDQHGGNESDLSHRSGGFDTISRIKCQILNEKRDKMTENRVKTGQKQVIFGQKQGKR